MARFFPCRLFLFNFFFTFLLLLFLQLIRLSLWPRALFLTLFLPRTLFILAICDSLSFSCSLLAQRQTTFFFTDKSHAIRDASGLGAPLSKLPSSHPIVFLHLIPTEVCVELVGWLMVVIQFFLHMYVWQITNDFVYTFTYYGFSWLPIYKKLQLQAAPLPRYINPSSSSSSGKQIIHVEWIWSGWCRDLTPAISVKEMHNVWGEGALHGISGDGFCVVNRRARFHPASVCARLCAWIRRSCRWNVHNINFFYCYYCYKRSGYVAITQYRFCLANNNSNNKLSASETSI